MALDSPAASLVRLSLAADLSAETGRETSLGISNVASRDDTEIAELCESQICPCSPFPNPCTSLRMQPCRQQSFVVCRTSVEVGRSTAARTADAVPPRNEVTSRQIVKPTPLSHPRHTLITLYQVDGISYCAVLEQQERISSCTG